MHGLGELPWPVRPVRGDLDDVPAPLLPRRVGHLEHDGLDRLAAVREAEVDRQRVEDPAQRCAPGSAAESGRSAGGPSASPRGRARRGPTADRCRRGSPRRRNRSDAARRADHIGSRSSAPGKRVDVEEREEQLGAEGVAHRLESAMPHRPLEQATSPAGPHDDGRSLAWRGRSGCRPGDRRRVDDGHSATPK